MSIGKLTVAQKVELLNHYLKSLGKRGSVRLPGKYDGEKRKAGRKAKSEGAIKLRTGHQLAEIERLFRKIGVPDFARREWFRRHINKPAPVTSADASKMIKILSNVAGKDWRWDKRERADR